MKVHNDEYSEKESAGKSTSRNLFELAWDVKELSELNSTGRSLLVEIEVLSNRMADPLYDRIGDNLSRKVTSIRDKLTLYVKGITRYRRVAATHILVVMISTEDRKQKPYALPVQCMPYKGLKDMEVRKIINQIVQEMVNRGMRVAGE